MVTDDNSPYVVGTVVQTSFGVGVIISCPTPTDVSSSYQVRLWRVPYKSIGTTAVANLRYDAMIKTLPAAPGMYTTIRSDGSDIDGQKVMVLCYYASKDKYLVRSEVEIINDNDNDTNKNDDKKENSAIEVTPDELNNAPSSKFYPLLNELMKRGDETAAQTTTFINKNIDVNGIVSKTKDLVDKSTVDKVAPTSQDITQNVQEITTSVQNAIPDEGQILNIYTMLKDEDLMVLLQKGKERLQQLVHDDIPKATKVALEKTGIEIVSADGDNNSNAMKSTFTASINKSRESALNALELLLKENTNIDKSKLNDMKGEIETNFTTMFDTLRDAAQSDQTLNTIFDSVSEKTSEWQEATGRLLSTKSASLFLEGANRLQARAKEIFSNDQIQWANEMIGSKFTKAFTEGDAAVARLKSVELGDAVRSRLITAIELRSESHGGLDGIIAGALSTIKSKSDDAAASSGDQIQNLLNTLQGKASTGTQEAHETLISVLSCRSQYRDVTLLRIESVLCDLEVHLGTSTDGELSAEDIASIARGEKGTMTLFEPIARKATKEINKQLDIAEELDVVKGNETIKHVLQRVRKILSGELTVSSLMNEVINILNDDKVVTASENLVKGSEHVLDAIEGVSGNKVVDDVLTIAEKAGITKDSVMKQMESLNVNEILDTAQAAASDEKARRQLLSSATDIALDFILRIIPSMKIPQFDGVKDGLIYNVSNLSMEGFKVKKENIVVEVAGMRATKKSRPKLPETPKIEGGDGMEFFGGGGDGEVQARQESERSEDSKHSGDVDEEEETFLDISFQTQQSGVLSYETSTDKKIKATELLIIDVRHISAVLDNAVWSFEQTYMPYLKGDGVADVKLSNGTIRLQFELRKRRKQDATSENGEVEWEPVLCLHDRYCAIGEVSLQLQGESRLTWVLNKLATIFKGPLRDYVVRQIVWFLTNKSGVVLEKLNKHLSPYWGLIMRTAKLNMDDLVEATEEVITETVPNEEDNLIELVWKEKVPLGMNLLLNDESGLLKVVDFPRGSQARAVCTEKEIDPLVFNGATIVAVNGSRFEEREELFEALAEPSRPKAVLFELANSEDAARIKRFVMGNRNDEGNAASQDEEKEVYKIRKVNFTESDKDLGIKFSNSTDNYGLIVNSFTENADGTVGAAERQNIDIGDILSHINSELVLGADGTGKEKAVKLLETIGCDRPLSLSFVKPYLIPMSFEKPADGIVISGGPDEFKLTEKEVTETSRKIVLKDFEEVPGVAEAGGILIGDHLIFINARPVGAGCRLLGDEVGPEMHEVYELLRNENSYPMGLTFARPKKHEGSRWTASSDTKFDVDAAETICVNAECYEQLGCVFGPGSASDDDIVITDLFAVPGQFQRTMKPYVDRLGRVKLSVNTVNGQFVPSYASSSIVSNALKRSWATNGRIEVLFCDDERKEWVHSLT